MFCFKNRFTIKVLLLTLFAIVIASNGFSQKTKTYYITKDGVRCLKSHAKYKRTVYKVVNKWIVKDYYLNDSLRMLAQYLNKRLTKKTGTFIYYYLNGNISQMETYENGIKYGPSKEYYPTGVLSISGNYDMGIRSGKWI